jgi:polysaccharide export outer membrane protein
MSRNLSTGVPPSPLPKIPMTSRSRTGARSLRGLVALAALTLFPIVGSGCGNSGPYIWYHALPRTEWEKPREYLISVGDTLSINVYEQPNISTKAKIRSDGRIEMPFVGEVAVVGKQPFAVAREIEQRLKAYIVAPRVTVNVDDSSPVSITVMGEVPTKGALTLQQPAELAQALAQAGGLTEFASESKIFVLRRFPQPRRIRFTYDAITQNQGGAANFPLRTGDVIIVE